MLNHMSPLYLSPEVRDLRKQRLKVRGGKKKKKSKRGSQRSELEAGRKQTSIVRISCGGHVTRND